MLASLLAVAVAAFPRRDESTAAFPHYPNRQVYALNGAWDFAFLNGSDYNASLPLVLEKVNYEGKQQVPSAWDAEWGTGLQYSRGAGVYKTTLAITAGRSSRLHFEACSLFCRIYVDGTMLHNSTLGGFTPFWVDVPASAAADRTLVVMASNVFDTTLTPSQTKHYDFYQYGGILREATLHVLPASGAVSVDRLDVVPLVKPDKVTPSGMVTATAYLRGAAQGKLVNLGLCWDLATTAAPCAGSKAYSHVNGKVSLAGLTVPGAKVWDPTTPAPALHTLTVFVYPADDTAAAATGGSTVAAVAAAAASASPRVVDSIQVRFGLRSVTKSGRHILINGKPTKLHGYNRHDMYPQLGSGGLPSSLYDSDLKLIQEKLKGNFIRGSHYPQDPRFLDRCDELGIFVWEETLAWGNYASVLTEPEFLAAQVGTANAILDRDTNHPSIILWGFFNEGESDNNESVPAYAKMAKTFKSRDATRLVTWADNRLSRSKCLDYADVISFNYYPGWYNGPADQINTTWATQAAWVAANHPDKPFIISETGAGGINHQHSKNDSRWSEEYQSVVDGADTMEAMTNENITGISLWQFCDIKVDQTNTSGGRPGGINNKGVVSQWREPKPAAAVVAAAYSLAHKN